MKKLIAIVLTAVFVLSGCSANLLDPTLLPAAADAQQTAELQSTAEPTSEATIEPTQEPTPELTVEPTLAPTATPIRMPGIVGSQAYDIIISLENSGVTEPPTQSIPYGFYWQSSITDVGVQFMYDITANDNHELAFATFTVFGEDTVGVLAYCASLPYEKADPDEAMAFVNEHLGEDAQVTIGDAIFTLKQFDGGTMLDVSVVGYDDYISQLIGG